MGLYLGSNRQKLQINNAVVSMHIYSSTPITNGIVLMSSNNYMLKDINGLFLTVKEDK